MSAHCDRGLNNDGANYKKFALMHLSFVIFEQDFSTNKNIFFQGQIIIASINMACDPRQNFKID